MCEQGLHISTNKTNNCSESQTSPAICTEQQQATKKLIYFYPSQRHAAFTESEGRFNRLIIQQFSNLKIFEELLKELSLSLLVTDI